MTETMTGPQLRARVEQMAADLKALREIAGRYEAADNRALGLRVRATLVAAGDERAAEQAYGDILFNLNRLYGALYLSMADLNGGRETLTTARARLARAVRAGAR